MAKPVRLVFLADDTQLRSALSRLVGQTAATQASLKALEKTGGDMKRVGRSMTVGLTLPILAAAAGAAVLATKYESTMMKIQTLAGASAAQVTIWSKQLLTLGPALGKTPQELADALYFIVSSGAKASDALGILTASAKASAVGLGDTQTVADLTTSALNAYGSGNLSAARATDVLLRAVKDGKGEASDFASTMGMVIPIAAEVGVSFDQVAAGMSAITLTGANASEAATQMRNIFTEILHPSAGVKKALDSIGMSAEGVRQELRDKGLLATLQDMQGRVGGNSAAFAKLWPNVRGLLGVLSLVGPNGQKVADVFKDVAGAGGDVNAAFDKTKQTDMFKFKDALAALSAAGIRLGDALAPSLAKVALWLSKMATAFGNLDPKTRSTIVTIALLVAAIGPLLYVLGSTTVAFARLAQHPVITAIALLAVAFITAYTHSAKFRDGVNQVIHVLAEAGTWIKNNSTWLEALGAGIGSFLAISKGFSMFKMYFGFLRLFGVTGVGFLKSFVNVGPLFGKAVTGMKVAWAAFNVEFLFSPIGIVIGLVVALALAFFIAYKKSETFRKFVHTAMHDIAAVAKVAWDGLVAGAKAAWKWIDANLVPVFKKLWAACKVAFAGVMAVARPPLKFFAAFAKIVGDAFGLAAGFVKQHWGTIKKVLITAATIFIPWFAAVRLASIIWKKWGTDIVTVLRVAVLIIKANLTLLWTIISVIFKAIYAVAVPIVKLMVRQTIANLKILWTIVKVIFKAIFTIIKFTVISAYDQWVAFWKAATAFMTASWAAFKAILSMLKGFFVTTWTAMKTIGGNAVAAIKNLVTGNFSGLAQNIINIWNGVRNFLSGIWNSLPGTARNAAQGVFDGIMGIFYRIGGAVSSAFSSVGGIIRSAINSVISSINGIHLPSVNIPGIGTVGGQSLHIPFMAEGGLVNTPTLAMVGEAGRELVLPLTKPARAMELLAKAGLLNRGLAEPRGAAAPPIAPSTQPAGKSVTIENLNVYSQARNTDDIGKDVAWQVRRALL